MAFKRVLALCLLLAMLGLSGAAWYATAVMPPLTAANAGNNVLDVYYSLSYVLWFVYVFIGFLLIASWAMLMDSCNNLPAGTSLDIIAPWRTADAVTPFIAGFLVFSVAASLTSKTAPRAVTTASELAVSVPATRQRRVYFPRSLPSVQALTWVKSLLMRATIFAVALCFIVLTMTDYVYIPN